MPQTPNSIDDLINMLRLGSITTCETDVLIRPQLATEIIAQFHLLEIIEIKLRATPQGLQLWNAALSEAK